MSSQVQSRNITSYLGVLPVNPPNVWLRRKNPSNAANSPDFTNYRLGDFWVNTVAHNTWLLQNKTGSVGSTVAPATPLWIEIANSAIPTEFEWERIATAGPILMDTQTGYYVVAGAPLVTFVLPTVAPAGTLIAIAGFSAGGWTLTQSAGQSIYMRGTSTIVGPGGSISSTMPSDRIELLCILANSAWIDTNVGGNVTII